MNGTKACMDNKADLVEEAQTKDARLLPKSIPMMQNQEWNMNPPIST